MNRQQRRAASRKAYTSGSADAQFFDERRLRHQGGGLDPVRASHLTDLLRRGLIDHRAGRLQQAEAAYRQILAAEPAHPDALHLLGVIAHQVGRNSLAIELIRRAIGLNSLQADTHNDLGNALLALGRLAEAEASYREALRLRPNYPEAHNNLGVVLLSVGRLAEAEASCREAVGLQPNYPEAHNNLGNVLCYLGRPTDAEACYREALRARRDYPEALNNLGNVLIDLGRLSDAEASYRAALCFRPNNANAHNGLGATLCNLGRFAEAEARCREALSLRSNYPEALNNLGNVLCHLGRPTDAEASYRKALRLWPDYPDAHTNLASALLLSGHFEEGWKEYEWRWKTKQISGSVRDFSAPLWNGEAIGERVLLLHAEQGLGDTLQFCRYVPAIATRASTVLEVQGPLVRLLSRLPGLIEIVERGDKLPSFDVHCPLMSLPRAVGTTLDTIPATIPYLAADPARAAEWRARLADLDGVRVGLVWAGAEQLAADSRRSITLDMMAPFGAVSGISFISLQKDEPAAQAANPPRNLALLDFSVDLYDFAETAALVDGLDLVISVDTAVAHLAGALGKPVWLLNRFDTDWRWLLKRDDSPWYPTLRQFRQPSVGEWNSVICEVRDALQRLAVGDRDQLRPRQGSLSV